MRIQTLFSCLFWLSTLSCLTAKAQNDVGNSLNRFLDSRTVAILHIQTQADNADGVTQLLGLSGQRVPAIKPEIELLQEKWQAATRFMAAQDVEHLYLVASLAEHKGHLLFGVVPGCTQADAQPLVDVLTHARGALSQFTSRGMVPEVQTQIIDGALVIGTATTLRRLAMETEHTRPFPLAKPNDQAAIQLTAGLHPDFRRALSEMLPRLPKWLGGGSTADALAGIESIELSVASHPAVALQFTVNTTDAKISSQIPIRLARLMGALEATHSDSANLDRLLKATALLEPQVSDRQVTWSIASDDKQANQVAAALAPYVSTALIDSARATALNNLRQLMLALHNYQSAFKRFPSVNENQPGESKLGWRVKILPFISDELGQLYQEFHHDEPFDSPHNRQLIPKMPSVFRCPLSRSDYADGKSNFRLPSSAETMWPIDRDVTFRDITDGTSNTIAIIEVDDEHAAVWTAPEPYAIDLDQPWVGLGGHFPGGVYYARCDGSIGFLPQQVPANILRALLTRAGGEVVTNADLSVPQPSGPVEVNLE